ncbi:carboxyl transferase domain-containing protein [Pseudonocardia xinjiangensis]|uniref:carboxyl transferase domain-containing protein n=1 Tax=Pseudonocardia xinjiangensis TaxID=75289 RepID=UPI0028A6AF09|nr:carboxyl transferase domain-containing protein [Pseudonocardia xinjiangensis]
MTAATSTGAPSTGAGALLATVLDAGSFRSWDSTPVAVSTDPRYLAELAAARARSGTDESVITGEGRIDGRRVAVLCSEFTFLGGSIGVAASERLVQAIERATAERLPLLAATASGGTRMQEGTVAFLRMAAITAAVTAHKAAGLPYLVYLRHPTTGGVFASWGSLGHITVAEPHALIGFLGPKVYSALHGERFPSGVQTAENLQAHGLVDAVLAPDELAGVVTHVLALLDPPQPGTPPAPTPSRGPVAPELTAWQAITATRRPERPGVHDVLRLATVDHVGLAGTGEGEAGDGLLLALARFGAQPCVLLGQDRGARNPLGPADLRVARRGMRLATELRLPLVTMIDTPGAALDPAAEEGGLAGEIARCIADLVDLPVPTVSVLLGQGTGGGALALLPADRVLAAGNAWLAPLPPEGAAAILHGDAARAPEVAQLQGVRAGDLHRAGAVDTVVPELPDAADEPGAFSRRLAAAVEAEVGRLRPADPARLTARVDRLRRLGLPG